jgi:tetratricopeptide (TPR) repeat protein
VSGRRRLARGLLPAALATLAAVAGPEAADAQVRMRNVEAQLLRESAARESQGDYDGAEAVLRRLLEENPASSGGLFALERVLRAKGEIVTILPAVDAFLAEQPQSSGVRSLELRVLSEVDSTEAVRREAEAWLSIDPGEEVPYREIARVYERTFGSDEALELLYRGRDELGRNDALALEVGDLLVASGRIEEGAEEWARAVGRDAAQVSTVTRRVTGLENEEDAARAGRRVVEVLGDERELDRRRAGSRIALDLGLEREAMRLSQDVADELDGRARSTFLTDVARRARDNDLVDVAAWAYDALGGDAGSPAERRQFDLRIVEVSLAAGDTATALEAQRRVVASYSAGSVDRRRATARVIRLEGRRADPRELRAMLDDFREDFPNAPELDEVAATVAGALQARGDPRGAHDVLEGIEGPKSSLERAYLLLAAGEVAAARSALLLALTGLPPGEATSVIQFAGLLGRVSPAAAEALAEAGVAAHAGQAAGAATGLAEAVESFEEGERAAVLAEAARIAADGGEARVASEIRGRLIVEYPESPEFAEAALALARYHARTPRGYEQAIRLLEDLIASRPNAAVVPDARVELERLRGRVG